MNEVIETKSTNEAPDARPADLSADTGNTEKTGKTGKAEEQDKKLIEIITELKHELETVKSMMADSAEAEKKAREEAAASRVRAKAAECSPGKLEGACDNLFSPDEVRAMSRAEVKKNLTRIKESMQRWH